ncbi:MAG: PhzF family phenazine biosynthesis protein [Prochlorococcaceae cyanobacterium]|jgi:PhzF family phenazine biosynthesis protein
MSQVPASGPALPALLIEAFAERPLAGNGAAVVLLDRPASDAWLQGVATSLRQSETAFLLQSESGAWGLRWFTPTCEVPLCGHATLAALLALGTWGRLAPGQAVDLHSRSGPLRVALVDPDRGWIQLPSAPLQPGAASEALEEQLRQRLAAVPESYWASSLGYHVALVPSDASLERLTGLGAELGGEARQGLVVMQQSGGSAVDPLELVAGQPADYRLRFFAPGLGIEEDPVTGSAHALVAPYWIGRLGRSVVGWQCSSRPGGMVCEAASSGMIRLTGTGQLLWNGSLQAQPDDLGVPGWARLWPGS